MTKLLFPALFAIFIVTTFWYLSGVYLLNSPNKPEYRVYVDENNNVFVNGNLATAEKAYELGRDMTVEFVLEEHQSSNLNICIRERGCNKN